MVILAHRGHTYEFPSRKQKLADLEGTIHLTSRCQCATESRKKKTQKNLKNDIRLIFKQCKTNAKKAFTSRKRYSLFAYLT